MSRWFSKGLWFGAPPWAFAMRALLRASLLNQEKIMLDISKLSSEIARLKASDDKALSMLQQMRDQNLQLQAQLQALSVQDPQAQDQIDALAAQAGQIADQIDAAVTGNTNVPDLPPAPTPSVDQPSTDQPSGA